MLGTDNSERQRRKWNGKGIVVVGFLLNDSAMCLCISGMDLLR